MQTFFILFLCKQPLSKIHNSDKPGMQTYLHCSILNDLDKSSPEADMALVWA